MTEPWWLKGTTKSQQESHSLALHTSSSQAGARPVRAAKATNRVGSIMHQHISAKWVKVKAKSTARVARMGGSPKGPLNKKTKRAALKEQLSFTRRVQVQERINKRLINGRVKNYTMGN